MLSSLYSFWEYLCLLYTSLKFIFIFPSAILEYLPFLATNIILAKNTCNIVIISFFYIKHKLYKHKKTEAQTPPTFPYIFLFFLFSFFFKILVYVPIKQFIQYFRKKIYTDYCNPEKMNYYTFSVLHHKHSTQK